MFTRHLSDLAQSFTGLLKIATDFNGLKTNVYYDAAQRVVQMCWFNVKFQSNGVDTYQSRKREIIKFIMEVRILICFISVLIVIFNKYIAKGFMFWEREIIKYDTKNMNEWTYRIPIILLGVFFVTVSILQIFNLQSFELYGVV